MEFFTWCGAVGVQRLNKPAVVQYISELNDLRKSPATISIALCAIRRLASEVAERGLIREDTAASISRIKGPRRKGVRLGNWLKVEEAEKLIHEPDTTTLRGKRDRALLSVLVGAGLRRSEAAQLSMPNIQMREGRWVLADLFGKHDRIRSVPISDWTKAAIDDWVLAAGIKAGFLFLQIDKANKVHQAAISAGAIYQIVRWYAEGIQVMAAPHDLRRTFAKLAHQGHSGLDQIQLALGHSSILTTERYLGVAQDLRDSPADHLGLAIT